METVNERRKDEKVASALKVHTAKRGKERVSHVGKRSREGKTEIQVLILLWSHKSHKFELLCSYSFAETTERQGEHQRKSDRERKNLFERDSNHHFSQSSWLFCLSLWKKRATAAKY
jgi:hypothetical protein